MIEGSANEQCSRKANCCRARFIDCAKSQVSGYGPLRNQPRSRRATSCASRGTLYPPHTGSKLLLATDKELEHESSYRSDFSPRPGPRRALP